MSETFDFDVWWDNIQKRAEFISDWNNVKAYLTSQGYLTPDALQGLTMEEMEGVVVAIGIKKEVLYRVRVDFPSSSQGIIVTPIQPRRKTPHRDSTKQRNMRSHVMARNRELNDPNNTNPGYYYCDICRRGTNSHSHYINSHIVAHGHAKTLREARPFNPQLTRSPSYVLNGLFLCRDYDNNFEDHYITIDGKGRITVTAKAPATYKKLHGTLVKWHKLINHDCSWPRSELLDFRNTLPPILSRQRQFDYGVEPDDKSTASNSAEDESVESDDKSSTSRNSDEDESVDSDDKPHLRKKKSRENSSGVMVVTEAVDRKAKQRKLESVTLEKSIRRRDIFSKKNAPKRS